MGTGTDQVGVRGVLAMIAVVGAAVLCCAGPVLIASGGLGVLGGALRNGWLIGAAVLLVVVGVGYTLRRRGAGRVHDRDAAPGSDCCPPSTAPENLPDVTGGHPGQPREGR
jgi:hypothetical protein